MKSQKSKIQNIFVISDSEKATDRRPHSIMFWTAFFLFPSQNKHIDQVKNPLHMHCMKSRAIRCSISGSKVWEINQFLLWPKTQLGEQSPQFDLSYHIPPLSPVSFLSLSLIFTHTNMHYTKRLLSCANKWTIDHCWHWETRCLIFTPAR